MDTNITFRIDSEVKSQMAAICDSLGMTTSTAFNIFAKAFVRENGMPFPISLQVQNEKNISKNVIADADEILESFASDYRRMAE